MQDETIEVKARPDFPNTFYRVRSVCEKLDLGKSTIHKYVSQNLFPRPLQISSRLSLYSGVELQRWVDEVAPQLAIQSRQPKSQQKTFY